MDVDYFISRGNSDVANRGPVSLEGEGGALSLGALLSMKTFSNE